MKEASRHGSWKTVAVREWPSGDGPDGAQAMGGEAGERPATRSRSGAGEGRFRAQIHADGPAAGIRSG